MQIKAGKLAFCCEDCAYYDQLYTFSATVSSYWETDVSVRRKQPLRVHRKQPILVH